MVAPYGLMFIFGFVVGIALVLAILWIVDRREEQYLNDLTNEYFHNLREYNNDIEDWKESSSKGNFTPIIRKPSGDFFKMYDFEQGGPRG